MKKIHNALRHIILICCIFLTSTTYAQLTVAVVPENYTRQEQSLFNSDVEIIKAEWAVRFPTIPLNFVTKFSHKTSFRCVQGNSLEGSYCNDGKVADFTNDLYPDIILVLVDGQTGGGYRNSIAVCGTEGHSAQSFAVIHELGHGLGLPDGGYGIMGATLGSVYISTFESQQIETIKQRAGITNDNLTPQVTITEPINWSSVNAPLYIKANLSVDILYVEIYLDGQPKGTVVSWARNPNCNTTDGLKFFFSPISQGQHTISLRCITVDNVLTESVAVFVN